MPPLAKIPICPKSETDECLSSWIERTACFYGCDLDSWVGQFAMELTSSGDLRLDLDLSDAVRAVVSARSTVPLAKLPPPFFDSSQVLPNGARLAFCEQCWDSDVVSGGQPYIRRHWLDWTYVHCATHRSFLSVKTRSVDAHAPFVSWQDVWASKPSWRASLQLLKRGGCVGLWSRVPMWSPRPTESLFRALERVADATDVPATEALIRVLQRWRLPCEKLSGHVAFPVLLENRIEVLCQAAALLTERTSFSNRETLPNYAQ